MQQLNKAIQKHFKKEMQNLPLFRVNIPGREVWDIYIGAFSKENDPVFRDPASSTHQCNHCENFIRRYGNIVAVDSDLNLISLFDVEGFAEYDDSLNALRERIKAAEIQEIFYETFDELKSLPYEACKKSNEVFRLGVRSNSKTYTPEEARVFGKVKAGETRTFHHFFLDIPSKFVDKSGRSVEDLMGEYRDRQHVLSRGLSEISIDTLRLVRDLINQGSLLNGDTHLYKVEAFIALKEEYDELPVSKRNSWCWINAPNQFAKFRNELIGVLCTELTQGEDLNKACLNWNKWVDPVNYMKAKAPITQRQIKAAKEFVEKNGYEESFNRRYATLKDIKASEILHMNVGKGKIPKVSIFDDVKSTKKGQHSRSKFDNVESISIGKFMSDVLPNAKSVSVYLENKHSPNLVTLTTSSSDESKSIFKYSNNYSQTFNGNLAGASEIKEAVKLAGGEIDGVLNFRLAWCFDGEDRSDLDAWALEPGGNKIGYSTNYRRDKQNKRTLFSGQLDVDNMDPGGKLAVENITWNDLSKMKDGKYKLWVNQYHANSSKGFKAEIEFNGELYSYEYNKRLYTSDDIMVAVVTLHKGEFSIEHTLPLATATTKELYGLETNNFHKVKLLCLSPNHWGENAVGDKHYLFALDGCKVDTSIRSFHNVDLLPDLQKHRKVLEVLGASRMIEVSGKDQLSGLGFNATVRNELIVKVEGTHKRVLKINF